MIGSSHAGITTETLNAIGNPWSKAGSTRWYVNDWESMVGLYVEKYNTGNPSYVELDGVKISNAQYNREYRSVKVWIDAEGAVHADHCSDSKIAERIIAAVDARIEAMMPKVEEMAVEFAAEPSEPETFVITVVRPTDGAVANVELKESEDGGVWTALADALPNAYDMIEDDEVIMGEHPRAVEWFEEGDDYSLCEWLQNAVVRLEDEHGNIVWKREGRPDELVEKAKDEACKRANAGGEDPWEAQFILKIGDEVIWDYHEDVEVAFADHYEGDLDDDHGCAVSIEADEVDGIASVTWYPRDGSAARAMDISLNPGDYNRIRLGADPVAEGWEDGCGALVCFDNAQEVE